MDCSPRSKRLVSRLFRQLLWGVCLTCGTSLFGGCSWFRGNQLEQYRADNERLISEYRAERDRASELALQNRALVGRVSDLEQRLATISAALQDPTYQRASQRQPSEGFPSGVGGATSQPMPPAAADPWQPSGGR